MRTFSLQSLILAEIYSFQRFPDMESFIQQAINQNEGDVAGEIEQSFQECRAV